MAIKPDYQAGSVSITTGTTALVGAGGANWLGADIQPGDTFLVENLVAVVAEVVDATHIVLAEPWTGSTLAASPYRIRYQPDGSRYSAAARDLIDQLGNGNVLALSGLTGALDEIPIFTGAGAMTTISRINLTQGVDVDAKVETLADRDGYDGQATGYTVLVADVGNGRSAIYFKLSSTIGDWSDPAFLTGPSGSFRSRGNWSGATTYEAGDVVLQNGSSWIAVIDHTNHAPPTLPTTSNTWWQLLSAAGNGFVFKGAYSGATAYVKDDVVLYNNSTWIALIATTGNTPPALPTTSNTQWSLIAAKGSGDVSGPASSTTGRVAQFGDATGKVLTDGGKLVADLVTGPASVVAGRMPVFNGTTGKILSDSGYTPVQNGTGIGQTATNIVKIGWATGSRLLATVDTSDLGRIWTDFEAARLLTGNGYQKFPGGLILQWGTFSNAASDYVQNFPIAFPNGCFGLSLTNVFAVPATNYIGISSSAISTTQYDVRCRNMSNGGALVAATTVPLLMIAVGF